jgi:type IV pilus assembly protein PilP
VKRKRFHRQKKKENHRVERNKILYFFSSLSVPIIFLFFMTGCGGGSPPSILPQKEKPPAVGEKKTEPVVKVVEKKESVEKKEEMPYTYNPVGKPDPFKPFIQMATVKEYSRNAPLAPLQKYEISQLKLVAIIIAPEGNIAMVEDSLGKGFFLKKGTEIGKNDGRVKKILKDQVIIEEVYEDGSGQKKNNEISLFLHRNEEGGES